MMDHPLSCEDIIDCMLIGAPMPRMIEIEAIKLQSVALHDLITRIDELAEAGTRHQVGLLWDDLVSVSRTYDDLLTAELRIQMPTAEVIS